MRLVVLPGDGVGPEIAAATVQVLEAASSRFALGLELLHDIVGRESLRHHGATVTPALLEKVRAADGLLLGPTATYEFKDEAKGEVNPSKFFRKSLDLYANIRRITRACCERIARTAFQLAWRGAGTSPSCTRPTY